MSALTLWWLTLGAGLVVVLLVAALLAPIVASAGRIKKTADELWTVGKMIAADTAQVDMLRQMHLGAEAMLSSLRRQGR